VKRVLLLPGTLARRRAAHVLEVWQLTLVVLFFLIFVRIVAVVAVLIGVAQIVILRIRPFSLASLRVLRRVSACEFDPAATALLVAESLGLALGLEPNLAAHLLVDGVRTVRFALHGSHALVRVQRGNETAVWSARHADAEIAVATGNLNRAQTGRKEWTDSTERGTVS
jgi:hypothetical protein